MHAAQMEEHHEDQCEFIEDPHTGRASMVRAMAQQVADEAGARPTFLEFLERMARTNAAEDLTPTEFVAVTPDGYAVFGQPFVTGQAVSDKNASFALDSVGLKLITQMGGTAAVGQVDDKLVLFDDLHGRTVKVAPNGRVEVHAARPFVPGGSPPA